MMAIATFRSDGYASHRVRMRFASSSSGEDVEISDEARQALERLLNELNDAEASGYAVPRPVVFGPSMNIFAVSLDVLGNKCGKRH
jgi:hypothetical protein